MIKHKWNSPSDVTATYHPPCRMSLPATSKCANPNHIITLTLTSPYLINPSLAYSLLIPHYSWRSAHNLLSYRVRKQRSKQNDVCRKSPLKVKKKHSYYFWFYVWSQPLLLWQSTDKSSADSEKRRHADCVLVYRHLLPRSIQPHSKTIDGCIAWNARNTVFG